MTSANSRLSSDRMVDTGGTRLLSPPLEAMRRAVERLPVAPRRRISSFEGTLAIIARTKELAAPVLNLGIGTSQFPLSNDLAAFSVDLRDLMSYGPAVGDEALRRGVADLLKWLHPGVDVPAEHVVITDGGSNALYLALMCVVRAGDEILTPEIHYPSFRPLSDSVGARLHTWKLDQRLRPAWASVRGAVSQRTGAILVDSPSNPFGVRLSNDEYAALASLGPSVVSDEVYAGVGPSTGGSILAHRGDHFMVGSFSKLFATPGLRLGFLVAPDWAVNVVKRMRFALNIATAIPSQRLGAFLLEHTDTILPKHRDYVRRRRQRTIEICREEGIPLVNDGLGEGFYVCVNVRALGMTSIDFAHSLLETAHVAVCPGTDFVAHGDPGFVRMNVAVDMEVLETGLRRVADFYRSSIAS